MVYSIDGVFIAGLSVLGSAQLLMPPIYLLTAQKNA